MTEAQSIADLEALARRCEEATGANRYVDYWAAFHCGFQHTIHRDEPNAPPFTASLDAAMSLVPEGWSWSLYDIVGKPESVRMWRGGVEYAGADGDVLVQAATPALALTAASLRARAAAAEVENGR